MRRQWQWRSEAASPRVDLLGSPGAVICTTIDADRCACDAGVTVVALLAYCWPKLREGMRHNRLLQLFDRAGIPELSSSITVEVEARQVLQEPGIPVLYAYFPETAVVSLVSTMETGASAEVALVGHE